MEDIANLIERFGVSVGLLVVIIVTLWKVGKWLAPRFDKWLEAQIGLTNTLRDKVNVITANLEQQTMSLKSLDAKHDNLSESIRLICRHENKIP